MILSAAEADVYEDFRDDWLAEARRLKPVLVSQEKRPAAIVRIVEDSSAYQGHRSEFHEDWESFKAAPISARKGAVIDFGEHVVGALRIDLRANMPAHAPVQLRFKFGETPSEVHLPWDDYGGALSKAWLQEEIVTQHTFPVSIQLPRRYAFRYLTIDVSARADNMEIYVDDVVAHAASSAGPDRYAREDPLPERFRAIEAVSLATLRNCMQTVFEDGPKRDRRIWVGDLKLQALANYYSFRNQDLVKRGLYLYAGTASEEGLVYGTLFEEPQPHPEEHVPIDYSLLYNTTLLDYLEATGDRGTAEDLWPVARRQVEIVAPRITADGVFEPDESWWRFIDWNEALDKKVALQGVAIYSLEATYALAEAIGKTAEVASLPPLIDRMKAAARERFFHAEQGVFADMAGSGQVSAASQAWMALSGVASPSVGRVAIARSLEDGSSIKPVSPYLFHYVVEAMIVSGMYDQARELISSYWGGMIDKGADTFWEVYDPENDYLSPYGSHLVNSYCHAWSCTPVYFMRKYQSELFGSAGREK